MNNPLLKIDHLSHSYAPHITALSDVNLAIEAGELVSIIGSNGSGKSTLLQILAGLIFPTSGSVFFDGEPITCEQLTKRDFVRLFRGHVGFVFQDADVQLFCPTVLDELLFGPLQLGLKKDEARERAVEIMRLLGIERLADRSSLMLSGGEKKRVAIGSVLTMNPSVLLLDEPLGDLDPRSMSFIVELIMRLNDAGKTIVMATHDLGVVGELNARVMVLSEDHRIIKTGCASDILSDTQLLLTANLVHEHKHRHEHGSHSHTHAHFVFHKHSSDG